MEETTTAKSVFEFLTARNPEVDYPTPSSQSLSSRPNWFRPKQLKLWCEFSFQTLEAMYGGRLMDEARQKGRPLPPYPYLKPAIDCVIDNESTTLNLLTKWNHTIVTASLDVTKTFHPCDWVPRGRGAKTESSGPIETENKIKHPPGRRCKDIRDGNKKPSSTRLIPDAGGCSSSYRNSPRGPSAAAEQLPKEYKTASKWRSSDVLQGKFIDKTGSWIPGTRRSNKTKPIEQIYTYCVNLGCRYGCILTTGEAFIFRIKPRTAKPGIANLSSPGSIKELQTTLANDGLMEYVSVPWDNHSSGDLDKYKNLTVNLALWFIHILAGNRHEISWDYGALTSEKPKPQPNLPATAPEPSQVASSLKRSNESQRDPLSRGLRSLSKKRKRRVLDEDAIHFSFSGDQEFAKQSSDYETDQSVQTDSGSIPEREREMTAGSQTSEERLDLSMRNGSRSAKRHRGRSGKISTQARER
ncbi:hypothetical protein BGZ60DRAFT_432478 [Tricladium varicosporioides]|nr:hypothetical protein BGZ60DRAFT_432478 [Hymenoscyphus varicosporioides]